MVKEIDCIDCGACCLHGRRFERDDLNPLILHAFAKVGDYSNGDGSLEFEGPCKFFQEGIGCTVLHASWRKNSPCDRLPKNGIDCRIYLAMAGRRSL